MAYQTANQLLYWLEYQGLTDAILPFLIIFTVLFAILQKTRIFGINKKNINAMIALLIALLAVVPHVLGRFPANADPIAIMNRALPNVSVLVVAIIMVLLLIGIFGGEATWIGGTFSGVIAILAFLSVLYFFGASAGWWRALHTGWWNSDTTALVVIILVFGIIIWFITKEETSIQKAGTLTNIFEDIGKFFKGGGGHH